MKPNNVARWACPFHQVEWTGEPQCWMDTDDEPCRVKPEPKLVVPTWLWGYTHR